MITYTYTDGNSCSNSVTYTITINALPTVAAIGNTGDVCVGSTRTLTNATTGGTWSSATTSVATVDASTGVVTGVSAGTSVITYTYTDGNSCSNNVNYTITVNPTPAQVTLSAVTQPTCATATGTFTITNYNATYTYTVSPSTGVTVSGNTITAPAETYTVTATLGSCSSIASANAVVNAQPATPAAPTFTVANGINSGTITVAVVAGVAEYSIDGTTFQTSNVFSGLAQGNYTITVKTAAGCINTAPATVKPVGTNDTDLTTINTPITTDVLGNDGASGTGATVNAGNGSNGITTVNADGTIKYTPNAGFTGTDSYTYTITKNGVTSDPITVTITVYSASLALTKKADNALAVNKAGDIIQYTLEVENTGTSTLTNIVVNDAGADAGSITPATIATLAAGAKATVTATHTLTQAEVNSGSFSNQASAKGKDPKGNDIDDEKSDDPTTAEPNDPTVVTIIAAPSITLVKTSVLSSNDNTIAYTFVITNTGNVTLSNLVLSDTKLGINRTLTGTLAPGASRTETETYTVTQADKDAGSVSNSADVHAKSPTGADVTDKSGTTATNDTPTVTPIAAQPKITLVKSGVLSSDGNTIAYTFVITNTGNVTLNNIVLRDTKLGLSRTLTGVSLAPGASSIQTVTYTLTQADKDAGTVSNTADVHAKDPSGTDVTDKSGTDNTNDTPTVTPSPADPKIALLKTGVLSSDGNTITYTFAITNMGNVTLNNIVLTDVKLGLNRALTGVSLVPGQIQYETATYTVTQAEKDAGTVSNTADVHAKDSSNTDVTDKSGTTNSNDTPTSVTVPAQPKITLVKSGVLSSDGNTIAYTFIITNTGNVTLNNIVLTDAKLALNRTLTGVSLALGASTTETATYNLTQADKDAGKVTNTAEVNAKDPSNTNVKDVSGNDATNDTPTETLVPENPGITLVKSGVLSTDGNNIAYSFVITNTGNVTLNNIVLTDTKLALNRTLSGVSLAPSASTTETVTYSLTQADKDAGSVSNTADVYAKTPANANVTDKSGTNSGNNTPTVTPVPAQPAITLVKTGVLSANGNTITYTFTIANTGNVTLNNIVLTDVKLGLNRSLTGTLAPGASRTETATYTVTQAEKDAGSVSNTADVHAKDPSNTDVTDKSGTTAGNDTPTTVTVPAQPKITLVKSGVLSSDGNTITYTFVITNTGNVTLDNLVLTDVKLGLNRTLIGISLAPGQSRIETDTYTLLQSDKDAGGVSNTADVHAKDPSGTDVTDKSGTDNTNDTPTFTPDPANPKITLVKTGVLSADGNTVTYTFTITNMGNVTLNNIVLTDVKLGLNRTLTGLSLVPGQIQYETETYTVTQAEKDAGLVSNTADVYAKDPSGTDVTDKSGTDGISNTPTVVPIPAQPNITLLKSGVLSSDGNTIAYTFVITNTGNVTLNNLVLTDVKLGLNRTLTGVSLAPGASTTETAAYTVTQGDKDAGTVNNSADVHGKTPSGGDVTDKSGTTATNDTPTVTPIPAQPSITLVKTGVLSANVNTIIYTFVITNIGNVTLNNLVLTDAKLGLNRTLTGVILAPGASRTETEVYTLTQADKDAGSVSNSADVHGKSPSGGDVTDKSGTTATNDTPTITPIPANAAIALVKTGVLSTDGTSITYVFVITNTGNVTLNNLVLTDVKLGLNRTLTGISLAPGATRTETAIYTLTQADKDAETVSNSADVHGKSPSGGDVTDKSGTDATNDTPTVTPVPAQPKITLVKTGVLSADGNTITYTFVITNTGNVTLNNLVLTDPKLGLNRTLTSISLAPGATRTETATYTLTQADKDAGSVSNSADVHGKSPSGGDVTDKSGTDATNDTPTVTPVPAQPKITLVKTAVLGSDGNTIAYTFVITNIGNVTLNNLVLTDAKLGLNRTLTSVSLAPGASTTETATYNLTQADKDAGSVSNSADVHGKSPSGGDVTDKSGTDATNDTPTVTPVPANPKITLVKTAVLSADGNTITYTFVITNTGNVTLNNLVLTDVKLGLNRTLTGISLAPGASTTETATYTLTQVDKDAGSVSNSADVHGKSPSGGDVTDKSGTTATNDTPTVTPVPAQPKITLVKTAERTGTTLTYTFTIKNTGNVTLNTVTLTDAKLNVSNLAVTVPTGGLLPGATVTTTVNYTITAADIAAGSVSNAATVRAKSPTNADVTDVSGTTETNDTPTVTPLPPPPVASNDSVVTPPNTAVTINILANDRPGNPGGAALVPSTLVIIQQPQHGTLTVNAVTGQVVYTPNLNYQGTDTFTYTVKDANGFTSNVATVTININDVPKIGLAKAVMSAVRTPNGSYDVTYRFTVGNFGTAPFKNVSIKDDLRQTFPGTVFQVKTIRTLGTLNVNTAYNGTTDIELLQSGNTMAIGAIQQVELVVNVSLMSSTTTTYNNRAVAEGESVTGLKTTDNSTNGLKPDPNTAGDVSPQEPTPLDLQRPKEFIPGGFSPNGDGVNDKFVIENIGFKRVSLEVFNRWGNRVYRSNDYQNDWDGRCTEGISIGQDLPEGTYFYIVILDGKEKFVGNITLKR